MPKIGFIEGRGESYKATKIILWLIDALNARFRSQIEICPVCGQFDSVYGVPSCKEACEILKKCGAVFAGDFIKYPRKGDGELCKLLLGLLEDCKILRIKGIDKYAGVDVKILSYFDGGAYTHARRDENGCVDERLCSEFAAKSFVRALSKACETRKRRLLAVKDGENEYLFDMFYEHFKAFALPRDNFALDRMSTSELFEAALTDPRQFDMIFASKTTAEALHGVYRHVLGDEFCSYYKYGRGKSFYFVRDLSITSHLAALEDMLRDEFGMKKEAYCLARAAETAREKGCAERDAERFAEEMISAMGEKLRKRF
ncbi:MAG: hypothetical protein LUG52_01360 [Clostridia bacterium]|nr:hypothetical protein [Clostridia bacterium]